MDKRSLSERDICTKFITPALRTSSKARPTWSHVPNGKRTGKPSEATDRTIDTIWEGALKSAKKAEQKLGEGNYGPWTDFEWGMINGKLSALRWALGEDWDTLDT